MSEEASAGEEDIQSVPTIILKEKAVSKNGRNIMVFSPPRSME